MTLHVLENDTVTVWVCSDCIMLAANDEIHPDLSEDEAAKLLSLLDGEDFTIGTTEHADDCGYADGEDCYCETIDFSSENCAGCGSHYAGYRHAITVWL